MTPRRALLRALKPVIHSQIMCSQMDVSCMTVAAVAAARSAAAALAAATAAADSCRAVHAFSSSSSSSSSRNACDSNSINSERPGARDGRDGGLYGHRQDDKGGPTAAGACDAAGQLRGAAAQAAFAHQEATCWSCSNRFIRGGLVCRGCDRIQPVDSSLSYYDLFSL